MHVRSLSTWFVLAAVGLAGTGCSERPTPSQANEPSPSEGSLQAAVATLQMDGELWEAVLDPVNAHVTERAVTGKAVFVLHDGVFTAMLDARGVAPGRVHPQHIHGHEGGIQASCPTPQADSDGDHIVSLAEGLPAYGPIVVSLDGELENPAMQPPLFPTPTDYTYAYRETATESEIRSYSGIPDAGDLNLETRAVVLHGAFVNGVYEPSLPVACGQIRRVR